MSVISDDAYNNLQWEECTIEDLQKLIQGATVLEAEAVDYPVIDGVDLVLRDRKGQLIVISFNANESCEEDRDPLSILWAAAPEAEAHD